MKNTLQVAYVKNEIRIALLQQRSFYFLIDGID
ncbi:hypothetical protein CCYN2B_110143 [Capnocytophaga cynodegmi]|uniref:Uncharacterized protein n=1 Tax=Capnocytophaga cynodegmi TaxID=28189 RepID=A0A0B7H251_9FLAO|nr:hypothetical protein CCYN2B_110143 [Capnocytophaga cynodegmi]